MVKAVACINAKTETKKQKFCLVYEVNLHMQCEHYVFQWYINSFKASASHNICYTSSMSHSL